jgi:hypothetical protein
VSEYTGQAQRLQLLPLGAKYSFGVDFALRMNEAALDAVTASGSIMASAAAAGGDEDASMTAGEGGTVASAATTAALLGGDLKRVFKPQLRELRAKMQRQTGEHTRHALELAEAATGAEEQRTELSRAVETVRVRGGEEGVYEKFAWQLTPPPLPPSPACS